MGIETEQRLRELEQRLAALESGVTALQGRSLQSATADALAPDKAAAGNGKSKAPARAGKKRSG